MRRDIRDLELTELKTWFEERGEKAFRANQVYEWLWVKGVRSFSAMSNLSLPLRSLLEDAFAFKVLAIDEIQKSKDGTIKMRFVSAEGHALEGVLIPEKDRMTACVSSQVGCSLSCAFCATGQMKRMKNLSAGEILDQFVLINESAQQHYRSSLDNLVFMGMGEPLLNFKEVKKAIETISHPDGINFSQRRITLSTAGIAKAIDRLADELKVRLALSLHAANDQKRDSIMAINQSNNLAVLKTSLQNHYSKVKRRISLEYIALGDFNIDDSDAKELVEFSRGLNCHVNVIEYNAVEGLDFKKAEKGKLERFVSLIDQAGIPISVRRSRGEDIDAACGQLANKN